MQPTSNAASADGSAAGCKDNFDQPTKVGTSQHFRWLRGITAAIILLNLVDALFTMTWLDLGLATEANPLMEVLTSWGPVPFVLGKVLLVSLGCYFIGLITFRLSPPP